ncbi:MAG: response regulator [Burkholderiaceae bacterium]
MPKILLVEDNEPNREMLSRRLLRKGFDVVTAVDGVEGLSLASSAGPDLILMDMSLPGIDGWEATRRLKCDEATRAIPVIALTAHAMSDDRDKALAAGCDEFDTKPIDLVRLLVKIEALLGARADDSTSVACRAGDRSALAVSDEVLPAVPASLSRFKAALDRLCEQAGVSADIRADLQVVLDEACANVIEHAYAGRAPGPLRVTLRHLPAQTGAPLLPAAIEIIVCDQGPAFDPLSLAPPTRSIPWQDRPLGGMGVHLIRSLTDSQTYCRTQAEGNCLSVLKNLP